MMRLKSYTLLTILIASSLVSVAQSNEKHFTTCDTQKFGTYSSTELVDSFFFNLDSLKSCYLKSIHDENFRFTIESKDDSINALLSCMSDLNCHKGINPKRLNLYNKSKRKLDSLNQLSIVEEVLPNTLNTFDQLKILESELIIFGKVVGKNHDLPGARFYHSEYLIQVDSILYSSIPLKNGDTVLIKKITGIDNGIPNNTIKNSRIWIHQDNTYDIGEQDFFCLSNYSYISNVLRSKYLFNYSDEICLSFFSDVTTLMRSPDSLRKKTNLIASFVKNYK